MAHKGTCYCLQQVIDNIQCYYWQTSRVNSHQGWFIWFCCKESWKRVSNPSTHSSVVQFLKIGPRDLCSLARIILCIVLPFIWYAAILGSVEPVLRGAWAPWSLCSVEPVLCGALGSMEPVLRGACAPWSLGSTRIHRAPQIHRLCRSTGSTDPQLHNSTIQLFYIKIIVSTENHPTLMNANGKMSIT